MTIVQDKVALLEFRGILSSLIKSCELNATSVRRISTVSGIGLAFSIEYVLVR